MHRTEVIQKLIYKLNAKIYLEIGVCRGDCLLHIKAPVKYAVDPNFDISISRKVRYWFKNPANSNNKYFEVTSDDFFLQQKDLLETGGLDIVFIDGLHTYEQSLKDVLNAIKYLNKNGIIILHDCNPKEKMASIRANSYEEVVEKYNWKGDWNGDVWKTILHLRSLVDGISTFVLDTDFGLGIVRPSSLKAELGFDEKSIKSLPYEELDKNRNHFLNLKPADYFYEFLKTVNNG